MKQFKIHFSQTLAKKYELTIEAESKDEAEQDFINMINKEFIPYKKHETGEYAPLGGMEIDDIIDKAKEEILDFTSLTEEAEQYSPFITPKLYAYKKFRNPYWKCIENGIDILQGKKAIDVFQTSKEIQYLPLNGNWLKIKIDNKQ